MTNCFERMFKKQAAVIAVQAKTYPGMVKKRRNLKVTLPCVHCREKIEMVIFEQLLESHQQEARGYWPNEDGQTTETKCDSCGTRQRITFFTVVEKI